MKKKVRQKIHYIFYNGTENKILKFWKYQLSVHEWLIYQYQLQKAIMILVDLYLLILLSDNV